VKSNIKFINHACFLIENDDGDVLFDPWFFGKVFNNSWSLLRETEDIDLSNVKYVIFTHEHPDHLHWPTLKKISNNSRHKINVLVPLRENKNIVENIRKLGCKCAEIPNNLEVKLGNFMHITNYTTGHDSAYVFKINDKVYLNQNDCQLSNKQCETISKKYPNIDFWMIQFSLAGYYANEADHEGLQRAKDFHINMIKSYHNFFKPRITIPFASFVFFCKKHNSFLNKWIIDIEEIGSKLNEVEIQILFYNDEIKDNDYDERNNINKQRWNKVFNNKKEIIEHQTKTDEEILFESGKFIDLANSKNGYKPGLLFLDLYDKTKRYKLDLTNRVAKFVEKQEQDDANVAGKLHSEELLFFLRFPWGADTLNITSCFEIKNEELWKNILHFKDHLYER
jgi:ribonuclease BN (tRNA processing enzyme)